MCWAEEEALSITLSFFIYSSPALLRRCISSLFIALIQSSHFLHGVGRDGGLRQMFICLQRTEFTLPQLQCLLVPWMCLKWWLAPKFQPKIRCWHHHLQILWTQQQHIGVFMLFFLFFLFWPKASATFYCLFSYYNWGAVSGFIFPWCWTIPLRLPLVLAPALHGHVQATYFVWLTAFFFSSPR